jgi:hypothetical protein
MSRLQEQIIFAATMIYFFVFFATVFSWWRYKQQLRNRHPVAWAGLGRPSFLNNSIPSGWRSANFLLRKRYEDLADPGLSLYGGWARIGFLTMLVFLVALAALVLIFQYQNGVWRHSMTIRGSWTAADIAFLVLFVAMIATKGLFDTRLRSRHPAVWEALGEPSILNLTISNSQRERRYVASDRHWQLADRKLSIYVFALRILFGVSLALFLAIIFGKLQA